MFSLMYFNKTSLIPSWRHVKFMKYVILQSYNNIINVISLNSSHENEASTFQHRHITGKAFNCVEIFNLGKF